MVRATTALWLGLIALAAAGVAAGAARDARLPQLLGFDQGKLVRVDPETLQPVPGKTIRAGTGGCAPRQGGTACWTVPPWTVSPGAKRLAVARNDASSLRLVDVARMRVTADIALGSPVGALAWIRPDRLLALQEADSERQRLVVVELASTRVTARRPLGGSVLQVARTPRELVALVAPAHAIGPARIAVADGRGRVRFVPLPSILAGSKLLGSGSDHRVDLRAPGLAVDPPARRAFVVDQTVVAEIDLAGLGVSYHPLAARAPAARSKQTSGYGREARWLGNGLLAIAGTDVGPDRPRATGLLLVDTRSWTVRTVDSETSGLEVAGDRLLATSGGGLAVYGLDGGKRDELFPGETTWLAQIYGGRAYVGSQGRDALWIVDLASGQVVGERRSPLPWLVDGVAAGWWEG